MFSEDSVPGGTCVFSVNGFRFEAGTGQGVCRATNGHDFLPPFVFYTDDALVFGLLSDSAQTIRHFYNPEKM